MISWQVKAIAAAIILAAIGGLLAHDHWLSRKYKAEKAISAQLSANLTAERAAREKERELNRSIDQQLQAKAAELDLERSKPLPRLQCRRVPVSTPSMPSSSGASSVDPTAAQGNDGQENATDSGTFDPAPELMQFAVEAQQNRDTLQACQDWIKGSR
jgi:hypothetical protein